MIKILMLITALSFAGCSSLKDMNTTHKEERKNLRIVHKEKFEDLKDKQKKERTKLQNRLEKEKEILKLKQAIQFVDYGSKKYKELKEAIEKLEEFLK